MKRLHVLAGLVSDAGTLSGGSWLAGYPVTNLQTTQPGHLARSSDATEASTAFVLDYGSSRSWQMFALVNHNLTSGSATVRIRVSENSDGSSPTLDETYTVDNSTEVWGALPWGVFTWDGVSEDFPGGFTTFYLHDATAAGRYVLIDISDDGNLDGYVQIGRFLAGVPFVPAVNLQPGFQIGIVDDSRVDRVRFGTIFPQQKPKRRRAAGTLPNLTEAEALDGVHDLVASVGRGGGVLIVVDPDDAAGTLMRRTVYGTFADLGAITTRAGVDYPYSWTFALEELVSGD